MMRLFMDYSLHDAIEAGFQKIIFVIRRDIEDDFRERIGRRVETVCKRLGVEIDYAFQELLSVPEGYSVPEDRTRPWGQDRQFLPRKSLFMSLLQ